MRRRYLFGVLVALAALPIAGRSQSATPSRYFPPAGAWERRDAASLGLDKARLDEAAAFSLANESRRSKDLSTDIPQQFANEAPYNSLIGPAQPRGGASGIVIKGGYVVAEWGDTERADMTFSVTKSFLSTVVGEVYERGLIKDLDEPAAPSMPAGVDLFASEHNRKITWRHLLQQSSDWSGTLWGKPDWADRPPANQTPEQWQTRALVEPGTVHEYNDTRVNVLALATLHLVREPLPVILKREIMDPIGASNTWHWEPYDNAYVTIDGKRMPSIPGGGHHGGGMFISARDMARFGYLFLNKGKWGTRQLVTEKWIELANTPSLPNPGYGFMNWYLNGNQRLYRSAPASIVAFRGNGENLIYIDWENDLVVVVRWLNGANGFFERVLAALSSGRT